MFGEPLFKDVATAMIGRAEHPAIYAGRYGLSSKDVSPAQMLAVFDNMSQPEPRNHFTVGINDDVTHLSIPAHIQRCSLRRRRQRKGKEGARTHLLGCQREEQT